MANYVMEVLLKKVKWRDQVTHLQRIYTWSPFEGDIWLKEEKG